MRFGGVTAVNRVDLAVQPKQIYSVIGPNGAGKTTVFNAITGIYEPTEGQILFDGSEVRLPFTIRTAVGIGTIALLTGFGALLAVNIEAIWRATVIANFRYQQAFPYGKAIGDFFRFVFQELPW